MIIISTTFACFLAASFLLEPILSRIANALRTRKARDIEKVLAIRAALRGWDPVNQKHARERNRA